MRFRVTRASYSLGWEIWVSACTAFLVNFLGFPVVSQEAAFDVALEILDSRGEVLRSYVGHGTRRERAGFYYGYSWAGAIPENTDSNLSVAVSAKALLASLEDLKKQIERDSVELSKALMRAGPPRD
jgi:hypothetical protein